jgi:Ca2+-binding EF-hand superfamily protein
MGLTHSCPSEEAVHHALTHALKSKSPADIEAIWDRVDKDKNGELDKDEAKELLQVMKEEDKKELENDKAKGFLQAIKAKVSKGGETVQDATVLDNLSKLGDDDAKFALILKVFDIDGDGKVKKNEFMKVLMTSMAESYAKEEEPPAKKAKTAEEEPPKEA